MRKESFLPDWQRLFRRAKAPNRESARTVTAHGRNSSTGSGQSNRPAPHRGRSKCPQTYWTSESRQSARARAPIAWPHCPHKDARVSRRDDPPQDASPSVARAAMWPARWLYRLKPAAGTRFRARECVLGDALHLFGCVHGLIGGALSARMGFHAVFAEINITGQLADNVDVNVARAIRAQRRQAAQRRPQINRPDVNVETKFLAQREQSAFRPLTDGQRVPLCAANGPEQNRVSSTAGRKRLCGKRHSLRVDGAPAEREFI